MSTVTEVNPRLLVLTEVGVSVWLDRIRRSLVTGAELARMVREECLRGVTANPSIFEKAILGSTDYDEELEALAHERLDAKAIYERIAIRDVQVAADVLADLHRETHGRDGFVSLEVSPELAHDTAGFLAEACDYWPRLDWPNVMIPGAARLSDRPLPRKGDGPERDGAANRQRAIQAALEPRVHRPGPDQRGGGNRHRGRAGHYERANTPPRRMRHAVTLRPVPHLAFQEANALLDDEQRWRPI
jgi:hypothetical protein